MAVASNAESAATVEQSEPTSELSLDDTLPPLPSLPASDALPLLPDSRDDSLAHDTIMADDPPTASTSTSTPAAHPSILKTVPPAPTPRARAGRRSVTFLPDQAPQEEPVVPAAVPARQFSEEEVAAWRSAQVDARQTEVRSRTLQ